MKPQVRAVRAQALDGRFELKALLVDLRPTGLRDRLCYLRRRDLTEQTPAFSGLRLHADLHRAQTTRDLFGLLEVADLPNLARAADRVDLFERALSGAQRKPTRDQVIPGIPVGDVDDVAGRTDVAHLLREDDLHLLI